MRPRCQRLERLFLLLRELLSGDCIDDDDHSYNDSATNTGSGDDSEVQDRPKLSQDILNLRVENGMMCKQFAVKETHELIRSKIVKDAIVLPNDMNLHCS